MLATANRPVLTPLRPTLVRSPVLRPHSQIRTLQLHDPIHKITQRSPIVRAATNRQPVMLTLNNLDTVKLPHRIKIVILMCRHPSVNMRLNIPPRMIPVLTTRLTVTFLPERTRALVINSPQHGVLHVRSTRQPHLVLVCLIKLDTELFLNSSQRQLRKNVVKPALNVGVHRCLNPFLRRVPNIHRWKHAGHMPRSDTVDIIHQRDVPIQDTLTNVLEHGVTNVASRLVTVRQLRKRIINLAPQLLRARTKRPEITLPVSPLLLTHCAPRSC